MKTTLAALAAIIAAITILLLPACASRKDAPDPIKVQEKIAEYRNQELQLVRSTVSNHERADRLIQLPGERDRLVSGRGNPDHDPARHQSWPAVALGTTGSR